MTAEIICVGTELLLGDIVNTNAQFLSRELAELGISVLHQHVIGDNPGRLRDLVKEAKSRSDLLVFSGGLGPTEDDLTKETVAEAFGDTLHFDEAEWQKIVDFFARTGRGGRTPTANNRKQAMVPTKGHKLPNAHGTAPGAWFEDDGCIAVLMPGVPREMKAMWAEDIRPVLLQRQNCTIHSKTLRVLGGESSIASKVSPLFASENPTAAIYCKIGESEIRVTARAATEAEAERPVMPALRSSARFWAPMRMMWMCRGWNTLWCTCCSKKGCMLPPQKAARAALWQKKSPMCPAPARCSAMAL